MFKVGNRVVCKNGHYINYTSGSCYNLPRTVGVVVEGGKGYIKILYGHVVSPPVNPNSFELVDEAEEAIKLLEKEGYTITPPKPKLTGEVVIYRLRNDPHHRIHSLLKASWDSKSRLFREARAVIAIAPWEENYFLSSEKLTDGQNVS